MLLMCPPFATPRSCHPIDRWSAESLLREIAISLARSVLAAHHWRSLRMLRCGARSVSRVTRARWGAAVAKRANFFFCVSKTLPGRLELPTLRLTASRSSQLSYGSLMRKMHRSKQIFPGPTMSVSEVHVVFRAVHACAMFARIGYGVCVCVVARKLVCVCVRV